MDFHAGATHPSRAATHTSALSSCEGCGACDLDDSCGGAATDGRSSCFSEARAGQSWLPQRCTPATSPFLGSASFIWVFGRLLGGFRLGGALSGRVVDPRSLGPTICSRMLIPLAVLSWLREVASATTLSPPAPQEHRLLEDLHADEPRAQSSADYLVGSLSLHRRLFSVVIPCSPLLHETH